MYDLLEALGRAAKHGVHVFSLRAARVFWEKAKERTRHHAVVAALNNGVVHIDLDPSRTPRVSWDGLSKAQQRAIAEVMDQLHEALGDDFDPSDSELVEAGIRHIWGRELDPAEKIVQKQVAKSRKGTVPESGGKFYKNLSDAAKYDKQLGRGGTEIWYMKPATMRNFVWDVDAGRQELPRTHRDLKKSHALLGKIKGTRPERIYMVMQGEKWSPEGESRGLIVKKGLAHTSMSPGDIIVMGRDGMMVDNVGFRKFKID